MAILRHVFGPAGVGLILGVITLCAGEASAAPPIVCVRNAANVDIDVVAGNLPAADGSHSLYCAVIVKKVDAKTRSKTSINELLRA